jgi:thiamine pyrophosphate-dependent acetolactate synthase large subunit-like protein
MHGTLDRRAVVAALLADRGDLLVVSGLGSPSYDLFAAGDHAGNFYLWGAMGACVPMAFGLAVAQPRRPVLALTGDGEMLMGIGSLATIAQRRPNNLSIVVLDNGHYGETGMQASHTGKGVALEGIAAACGFATAVVVEDMAGVSALRPKLQAMRGPLFASVRISADNPPRALPPRDTVVIKARFRAALGFGTI